MPGYSSETPIVVEVVVGIDVVVVEVVVEHAKARIFSPFALMALLLLPFISYLELQLYFMALSALAKERVARAVLCQDRVRSGVKNKKLFFKGKR